MMSFNPQLGSNRIVLGFLIVVLSASLLSLAFQNLTQKQASLPEGFYLGITASGDVSQTKKLIDDTRTITNLVVFTNLEVTMNITRLEEVSDYAFETGMNFLVYIIYPSPGAGFNYSPIEWVAEAKAKYGNRFLGYYLWDEPGGRQLDRGNFRQFDNTTMPYDYRDAANTYVYYLYLQIRDFIKTDRLFTSDYGLYWYDYEAGYDVVLSHIGWNSTRALDIAQCRGAAELHNKTWGAIMTWTYDKAPYIESPMELYRDMVMVYEAGAKYVVVFNYPTNVTSHGVLTDQHLEAIAQFNLFVAENPQNKTSNIERVAYVLPDNYGWGLRNPQDTIWGVWPPDHNSQGIWNEVASLAQQYGNDFDILIGSPWTRLFGKYHYDKLIWWNITK